MARTVACPADFDLEWALRFLGDRAVAGVESADSNRYRRVVATRPGSALQTVTFSGSAGSITASIASRRGASAWLVRQFDLGSDRAAFRRIARGDPLLRPLVDRRPGLRLPQLPDPFEALVRAVVGQVVSVQAARTFLGRLAERFGEPLGAPTGWSADGPEPAWRAFPTAEALGAARPAAIRAVGLTDAKARAIATAARAVTSGEIDWTALAGPDGERAERTLRALPGIGPWTSSYVRLRGLGGADAFLPTDLGVVTALNRLGVATGDIERRAERWRPWRGYAVPYLWASLAG